MQSLLSELAEAKGHDVHSIPPNATVADAVKEMHDQNVGALLVLEGADISGIFTERDVLFRVVNDSLDPKVTTVAQVMTKDPLSATPATTVEDAMRQVTDKRVRHLPLVDSGKLVGMISSGDLTRWVVRTQEQEIKELNSNVKSFATKNRALLALVGVFAVLIAVGIATS